MTKEREALKLALEAVKNRDSFLKWHDLHKVIEEALAQPEQEPVAWEFAGTIFHDRKEDLS